MSQLFAFPKNAVQGPKGEILEEGHEGMTLRDYFAAEALKPILDNNSGRILSDGIIETCVVDAYKVADRMIKERTLAR